MFHNFLNNVLLIEKINSSVFLKIGPKTVCFGQKALLSANKFLFLAMVCPLRGGGIPLFVNKFSLSFWENLVRDCPPNRNFL